ncbi:MAG: prephenate dehydrogenase/arogenate dehydrogenase family protein [Nitrospinae bacterium]|nr:prephenate dehydrogenase/arogenate dehydrogenase family protein [Nitrospinota bacterium]
MAPLFSRALFAGVGLIGGSLALAAREAGLIGTAVGYGRNRETLEQALALGIVDEIATDPAAACAGADLLFVATPVESVAGLVERLAPHLPDGCVVTDGGSVKGAIVERLARLDPRLPFVGGHPVAGTEKSGPQAAFATLYKDRYTILTPVADTDPGALAKVARLWEGVGAKVVTMTPADHDRALAMISHLPHLTAYALVDTLAEGDPDDRVGRFIAGGFKSTTRIAASDPAMWRDIFSMNRAATLDAVRMFAAHLARFADAIEEERYDDLLAMLRRARERKLALDERAP